MVLERTKMFCKAPMEGGEWMIGRWRTAKPTIDVTEMDQKYLCCSQYPRGSGARLHC